MHETSKYHETSFLHYLQGAMCLDGSAPIYYMSPGYGDGADKWMLVLSDYRYCSDTASCYERTFTRYGTSGRDFYPAEGRFFGILGSDPAVNPDFYNWNHVDLISCDGGNFLGDRQAAFVLMKV